MIETWAKWMTKAEAEQLMDEVNQTPIYLRKPSARLLGDRLRLTDQERQELAIVTIRPHDVTDVTLRKRRKAEDAERKWRKRRAARTKPREAWLANCKSRTKPWKRYGIGRRQWERRMAAARKAESMSQVHVAGVSAVKINKGRDRLASSERVRGLRGNSRKGVAGGRDLNGEGEQVERTRGGAS
jgi:hypothetical protein